jgi:hypothetical protein
MKWEDSTLKMEMEEVINMMEDLRKTKSTLYIAAADQRKLARIASKASTELSRQMEQVIKSLEQIRTEVA